MADPTFPLNVQAGSPKFYISAVGNKNVGDYITVPTVAVSVPSGYSVIGNAYYTIMQDGDQDSWMTFYMPPIEDTMGSSVDVVITSAGANNNFSTTGNSTYMQCVWAKEYYESITTYISNISIGIPSGCIIPYGGTTIPNGWLLCDGSSVSTDTYPSLFNAIKYTYGGSGSSFNLPNLTGRVPLGVSESHVIGSTGGSETVTLTIAQMPSHNHSGSTSFTGNHSHSQNGGMPVTPVSNKFSLGNTSSGGGSVATNVAGAHSHSLTIGSTGGNGSHNNMPPYISLNYIIKT